MLRRGSQTAWHKATNTVCSSIAFRSKCLLRQAPVCSSPDPRSWCGGRPSGYPVSLLVRACRHSPQQQKKGNFNRTVHNSGPPRRDIGLISAGAGRKILIGTRPSPHTEEHLDDDDDQPSDEQRLRPCRSVEAECDPSALTAITATLAHSTRVAWWAAPDRYACVSHAAVCSAARRCRNKARKAGQG